MFSSDRRLGDVLALFSCPSVNCLLVGYLHVVCVWRRLIYRNHVNGCLVVKALGSGLRCLTAWGNIVMCAEADGSIRVWSSKDGADLRVLQGGEEPIHSMAAADPFLDYSMFYSRHDMASQTLQLFAICGRGYLHKWNLQTGAHTSRALEGCSGCMWKAQVVSVGDQHVVTGVGGDKFRICVRNSCTLEEEHVLKEAQNGPGNLLVSGESVLCAFINEKTELWPVGRPLIPRTSSGLARIVALRKQVSCVNRRSWSEQFAADSLLKIPWAAKTQPSCLGSVSWPSMTLSAADTTSTVPPLKGLGLPTLSQLPSPLPASANIPGETCPPILPAADQSRLPTSNSDLSPHHIPALALHDPPYAFALSKMVAFAAAAAAHHHPPIPPLEAQSTELSLTLPEVIKTSFEEISAATEGLSRTRVLGRWGFGCVYHGRWQGRCVAIKSLDDDSLRSNLDFYREVQVSGRYRHPNLVSLLAYCDVGEKHRSAAFLVYPLFVCSVDRALADAPGTNHLDAEVRLIVASDIAAGLAFLHNPADGQPALLLCNFNSSNVLLDDLNRARISDLGCSCPAEASSAVGRVTVGTLGSIDPDYLRTRKFTRSSNIHAFGVILSELLTGLPANNALLRLKTLGSRKTAAVLPNGMAEVADAGAGWELVHRHGGSWAVVWELARTAFRCINETLLRPDTDEVHRIIHLLAFPPYKGQA